MSEIQHSSFHISTSGKGFYDISSQLKKNFHLDSTANGILLVFLMHTSASLCIQESYDPTAKADMEHFLELLAPENEPWHRHTLEGSDDTTSHLKSLLTGNQLTLPIVNGELHMGKWQGVYLCEHRRGEHRRQVWLTSMIGES